MTSRDPKNHKNWDGLVGPQVWIDIPKKTCFPQAPLWWVTQKPTSIQSGQSGRDAVEYDLREIDRAEAAAF